MKTMILIAMTLLLAAPAQADVEGDTCEVPFIVGELPYEDSGDTGDMVNDYSVVDNFPGNDAIYQFTPEVNAVYAITVDPDEDTFDPALAIFTDCDDIFSTIVGWIDENKGETEELSVTLTSDTEYYIIVDGDEEGSGTYVLTLELSCTLACEGKECGDDGCGGVCGVCESGTCLDGVCHSGAGCETSDEGGCDGCDCEECVVYFVPGCQDNWDDTCVQTCVNLCGGCGDWDDSDGCGDGVCTFPENCLSCADDCCYPGKACSFDYDPEVWAFQCGEGSCADGMEMGCCEGDVLYVCSPGLGFQTWDCGADEMACGWSDTVGRYYCGAGLVDDPDVSSECPAFSCVPACADLECGLDPNCGEGCGACGEGESCLAGSCVSDLKGNTCENPFEMDVSELPLDVEGDTSDNSDDVSVDDGVCPGWEETVGVDSPDEIYKFEPEISQAYTLSLTPNESFDAALYIVTDCDDIDGTCVSAVDVYWEGDFEELSTTLTEGQTYYIIVDGYGGSSGTYSLTLDLCTPDCEGSECGSDGCDGSCGECMEGNCLYGACYSGAGCEASENGGCGGCACEDCVSSLFPECQDTWSEGCVGGCLVICGGCVDQGGCGDGSCDLLENCIVCPEDCGCPADTECGYNWDAGEFQCGEGSCAPGMDKGCCDDDVLYVCLPFQGFQTWDCGADGNVCGWSDDEDRYFCGVGLVDNPEHPSECPDFSCESDCADKECGDDGCGEECGSCGEGELCEDGVCVEDGPDCDTVCAGHCGDFASCDCGDCPEGEECVDNVCEGPCTPDCADLECGTDGCDGSCGDCENGYECQAGTCILEIGEDVSDGTCTSDEDCEAGESCNDDGVCESDGDTGTTGGGDSKCSSSTTPNPLSGLLVLLAILGLAVIRRRAIV